MFAAMQMLAGGLMLTLIGIASRSSSPRRYPRVRTMYYASASSTTEPPTSRLAARMALDTRASVMP